MAEYHTTFPVDAPPDEVVAYVAEAIVTETIAASIEARSFIGGKP